jgi:predicted lipoprotein with Yx(FWY)xxD motif
MVGLCLAVLAAATTTGVAAGAGRAAKVVVRHTALGNILANGRGLTVYVFSRDSRNHDRCVSAGGCSGTWPPLTTSARPRHGPGIKGGLLGTIKLPGGAQQVTYAGHPLYTYIADGGPGQTFYVGVSQFGGTWYAVNAAGRVVK